MLLNLPTEIIVQIFRELTPSELLACQLTSKCLHNIVCESVVLQYNAALVSAKAEDNPCSNLTIAEKLRALKASEKAWSFVGPGFSKSVPVLHIQSGVYDLTGGVYLLSNSTRTALHYLRLPSKESDEVSWQKIVSEKSIIDIGLCLYEHDLMVIVTTTPHRQDVDSVITYNIELQLLQFSTGKPHPLARESRIHVINSEWEKPAVGIEIVGDHLVLILSYSNGRKPDDRVFIYEWKTNVLKVSFLAPHRSYSGLLFLTEHLILIPNTLENTLDVFQIPSKPTLVSPTPILVLRLPQLAERRILGGISTRAEPNPIGAASQLGKKRQAQDYTAMGSEGDAGSGSNPTRGFLASAEDAICIFDLRILVLQMILLQGGGMNMNLQFRHRFTFIVHRKALVALVEKYGRKEEHEHADRDIGRGSDSDSETAANQDTGNAMDVVDEEGHEHDNDNDQHEEHSLPGAFPSTPSSGKTVHPTTPAIPWSEWGPPITRWFNSDDVSTHWITTTAGQRCVRMEDNPPGSGVPIIVLDFNPNSVRRLQKYWDEESREREEGRGRECATILEDEDGEPGSSAEEFQQGSSTSGFPRYNPAPMAISATVSHLPSISEEAEADGGGEHWEDGDVPPWAGLPASVLSSSEAEGDLEETEMSMGGMEFVNGHDSYSYDDEEEEWEDAQEDMETDYDDPDPDSDSDLSLENGMPYFFQASHSPVRPGSGRGAGGRRVWYESSMEQVEPADTFAEPVVGGLPYLVCVSEGSYTFDGVLLDEERVIGLRTNLTDHVERVEILHFG